MASFRPLAFALALLLPASSALVAQNFSSSNSGGSEPAQQAASTSQKNNQQPELSQGELSVQARIRARRAQRRAQAIKDTYGNAWEVFVGAGYLRFRPGNNLQRVTLYSWDTALTHYHTDRFGITLDARGYNGTPYVGINSTGITRPAISQYDLMGGATYRFVMHPKYSIAGRALGGVAIGNFSGDTNGFGTKLLGLYPDGNTYAMTGSIIGEANITPNLSLRLGGDYLATGFGSTMQNSLGSSFGFVYRFGKK